MCGCVGAVRQVHHTLHGNKKGTSRALINFTEYFAEMIN